MSLGAMYWTDTIAPLGASATFTGVTRDAYGVGANAGASEFALFNATFYADQTGTAYIDYSSDGVNWSVCRSGSVSVSTPFALSAPIQAQFYRTRVINGSTPEGTLVVRSGFTTA